MFPFIFAISCGISVSPRFLLWIFLECSFPPSHFHMVCWIHTVCRDTFEIFVYRHIWKAFVQFFLVIMESNEESAIQIGILLFVMLFLCGCLKGFCLIFNFQKFNCNMPLYISDLRLAQFLKYTS